MNHTLKLIFTVAAVMLGLCACSSDHGQSYLEDKYDDDFTYIGKGYELWSDKQTTLIYEDKNGKAFSVEEYHGDYIDNYGSALYDDKIQKELQALYGNEYKVFFSSAGVYFSENKHFESSSDYLKNCPTVNIKIITNQAKDYDEIAAALLSFSNDTKSADTYYSVVIYNLDMDAYDKINSFGDEILPSNIEDYGSFTVKNGQIQNKSRS